jgi:hypothetical protein
LGPTLSKVKCGRIQSEMWPSVGVCDQNSFHCQNPLNHPREPWR